MRFTKEVKNRIWKIISDAIGFRDGIEILESKGYSFRCDVARWDFIDSNVWKKPVWKVPIGSKSIFFLVCEISHPEGVRMRYYLDLPKELAEKILILNFLPDVSDCTRRISQRVKT